MNCKRLSSVFNWTGLLILILNLSKKTVYMSVDAIQFKSRSNLHSKRLSAYAYALESMALNKIELSNFLTTLNLILNKHI